MEFVEIGYHVSIFSIVKELNIVHKTICNRLSNAVCKRKHDLWMPRELMQVPSANQVKKLVVDTKKNIG